MHLPAGELSRNLLFGLSPDLMTLRGSALAATCFAFYYSKHHRKVALLKPVRGAKSRLQMMTASCVKWLRLLGLTEEGVETFNNAVSELFTCLWVGDVKSAPAPKVVQAEAAPSQKVATPTPAAEPVVE